MIEKLKINDSIGIVVRPYSDTILLFKGDICLYKRPCKGEEIIKINCNHTGEIIIKGAKFLKFVPITKYKLKSLPAPERFDENKFKIIFSNVIKSPLVVYRKKGIIFVNNYYLQQPLEWKKFMIYHELGHQYHQTETGADTYALNMIAKNGGNLSQVYYCLLETLKPSESKNERLKNIIDYIKNIEKNEKN
jgi:hypothetical protein